jgi:hypothetical protein
VTSAAVNMGVQIFLLNADFDIYPGVVSQDHMTVLFLVFGRISIVTRLIFIPLNGV